MSAAVADAPPQQGFPPERRRMASLVVMALAVVALVAAVVVYFAKGDSPVVYWSIFGALVLVLVAQVALFLLPAGKARAAAMSPTEAAPGAMGQATPAPEEPPQPKILSLRCGDCGTVFDITDTGERPLYHTCPGCGAEGVLRAEQLPPPQEAAPQMRDFAAPPAAPVKKLKLRCGGCKEIFTIDDTGERPLRRPCPYCSRMGEVK